MPAGPRSVIHLLLSGLKLGEVCGGGSFDSRPAVGLLEVLLGFEVKFPRLAWQMFTELCPATLLVLHSIQSCLVPVENENDTHGIKIHPFVLTG